MCVSLNSRELEEHARLLEPVWACAYICLPSDQPGDSLGQPTRAIGKVPWSVRAPEPRRCLQITPGWKETQSQGCSTQGHRPPVGRRHKPQLSEQNPRGLEPRNHSKETPKGICLTLSKAYQRTRMHDVIKANSLPGSQRTGHVDGAQWSQFPGHLARCVQGDRFGKGKRLFLYLNTHDSLSKR